MLFQPGGAQWKAKSHDISHKTANYSLSPGEGPGQAISPVMTLLAGEEVGGCHKTIRAHHTHVVPGEELSPGLRPEQRDHFCIQFHFQTPLRVSLSLIHPQKMPP